MSELSSEEPVPKYKFVYQVGRVQTTKTEEHAELEDAKQRAVQLSRETGALVCMYQVGLYENILIGQIRVEISQD